MIRLVFWSIFWRAGQRASQTGLQRLFFQDRAPAKNQFLSEYRAYFLFLHGPDKAFYVAQFVSQYAEGMRQPRCSQKYPVPCSVFSHHIFYQFSQLGIKNHYCPLSLLGQETDAAPVFGPDLLVGLLAGSGHVPGWQIGRLDEQPHYHPWQQQQPRQEWLAFGWLFFDY